MTSDFYKLNNFAKIVEPNDKNKMEILKENSTLSQSFTFKKVGSAIFYGLTSVLIVFVNKILLTNLR